MNASAHEHTIVPGDAAGINDTTKQKVRDDPVDDDMVQAGQYFINKGLLVDDRTLDHTEWPYNNDLSYTGPDQTPYDRKYGKYVDIGRLERFQPPRQPKMPEGSRTLTSPGWSNGARALSNIDRCSPGRATPSRTRSRTLECWQTLPDGASFKWDEQQLQVLGGSYGPAWSFYSSGCSYERKIAILPFGVKKCPACSIGRGTRRNCMLHDFHVNMPSTAQKRRYEDFHADNFATNVVETKRQSRSKTSV